MRLILNLTNMSNLRHFFKTGAVSHFLIGIATLSLLLPCFAGADPNVKPQDIPDFLTQKGKSLSALKAVMNITSIYDAGKSRQDVKGFLLYRRPNDFRFQGLAAGGNSLFELIIKSNNFELLSPY